MARDCPTGKGKGGKGKDPKGKAKGKGKDQPAGSAGGKAAGKGKVDSEGRPLRCVHHWFGLCRNHPLGKGQVCRFGPHVGQPRDDEKLRPQFLKMEELYGKWEPGKFKYPPTPAAAARKAKKEAGAAEAPAGGSDVATPGGSPRR